MTDVPGITKALAEAAGRIGALAKTEQNKEQGFMFRSIDAILAASKPVFADLGISVTPKVLDKDYQEVTSSRGTKGWRCTVTMEYTFALAADASEKVTSMAGEAIDYGDKSTTKAEQMAYKYALTQTLLIGSTEADPDSESHEVIADQAPLSHGAWLKDAVQALSKWDDEQKKLAYKTVMEDLKLGEVDSMSTAKAVFEAMHKAYMADHPPADDTAPF